MLLLLAIRQNHGDNSDQDPFHQMWLAASELDIFLRSQNRMLLYDDCEGCEERCWVYNWVVWEGYSAIHCVSSLELDGFLTDGVQQSIGALNGGLRDQVSMSPSAMRFLIPAWYFFNLGISPAKSQRVDKSRGAVAKSHSPSSNDYSFVFDSFFTLILSINGFIILYIFDLKHILLNY